MNMELDNIQKSIDDFKKNNPDVSLNSISDTFHTFGELYHHRTVLLALGLRCLPYAWKSRQHEDGSMYDGMFIVGAPTPSGMITYHCDNEYWNLFKIPVLPHAPKFDGHTPDDVLDRIETLLNNSTSRLLGDMDREKIEKILEEYILPTMPTSVEKAAFIGFYRRYV